MEQRNNGTMGQRNNVIVTMGQRKIGTIKL